MGTTFILKIIELLLIELLLLSQNRSVRLPPYFFAIPSALSIARFSFRFLTGAPDSFPDACQIHKETHRLFDGALLHPLQWIHLHGLLHNLNLWNSLNGHLLLHSWDIHCVLSRLSCSNLFLTDLVVHGRIRLIQASE